MKIEHLKKWLLIASSVMLFSTAASAQAYKAGTYTCAARGHNGDVQIQVTVSDKTIDAIEILKHEETDGVGDVALDLLPKTILHEQSLAVDTLTGATYSSKALLVAAENCLKQAGADITVLKTPKTKEQKTTEVMKDSADVVVIGAGGAGMSAAYAAAKNGATVIVIEKTAILGGNTVRSGGGFNAADPKLQKKQNISDAQLATIEKTLAVEPKNDLHRQLIEQVKKQFADYKASGDKTLFDSPEFHALQTYAAGDFVGNLALVYELTKTAPIVGEELESLGLIWNDNTSTYIGALWPRSHDAKNYKSGKGYIETYKKAIEDKKYPVKFVTQMKAESLIMDGDRVVGVKAVDQNGGIHEFTAKKGVILASGGFGANVAMRMKYDTLWDGNLNENILTTNSPAITGDGIVMAEAIGANLVDMGLIQLLAMSDPKTGVTSTLLGSSTNIYVNKNGKRFVNELERRDVLAKASFAQPDSGFYLIVSEKNARIDKDGLNKYGLKVSDMLEQEIVYKADTIAELAKKINIDPAVLEDTINKWNEFCKTQKDPEFGRPACSEDVTLFEGPYYALFRKPAVHHTMGGVQINEQAQVLNKEGKPIPGLWAAGEVTGGVHGTNRVGANAIPDILSFGRIAGQNASK